MGCGCEALLPSASCTLVHGGRSLTSAGAWVQGRMSVTGGCVPASMLTSAVSSSSTTPPPGVCTGTVQLVQGLPCRAVHARKLESACRSQECFHERIPIVLALMTGSMRACASGRVRWRPRGALRPRCRQIRRLATRAACPCPASSSATKPTSAVRYCSPLKCTVAGISAPCSSPGSMRGVPGMVINTNGAPACRPGGSQHSGLGAALLGLAGRGDTPVQVPAEAAGGAPARIQHAPLRLLRRPQCRQCLCQAGGLGWLWEGSRILHQINNRVVTASCMCATACTHLGGEDGLHKDGDETLDCITDCMH